MRSLVHPSPHTRLSLNRDDLMVETVRLIQLKWEGTLYQLAKEAQVGLQTLTRWQDGSTMAPRIATLRRVLRVLGYDLTITKTKGRN